MENHIQYLSPFIMGLARYFLLAGIPFLIFYLIFPEKFSKNKIQARFAKRKDFYREILHSLQTILIISGVGLLILRSPLRPYTQLYTDLAEYSLWWVPISIVLALMIHDTYFYWMHRTVHHPKLFKQIHLLHHKSVNPSPWASYSFHFWEGILEALVAPIILFLIPLHPLSLILFTIVAFGINVYGHLGYEIAPKWFRYSFLFEIMNTSIHHNLHHKKFKGNYGLYFRIWDRVMGTENPDYVKEYDEIQARRFGQAKVSGVKEVPTVKKAVLPIIFLIGLAGFSARAQNVMDSSSIEGNWRDDEQGGVIKIYEENGLFYGQLISADEAEKNEKIQAHGEKILILRKFQKISDTQYCCGLLYAPLKKKTLNAKLEIEDKKTLRIDAKYGILKGSRTLRKL